GRRGGSSAGTVRGGGRRRRGAPPHVHRAAGGGQNDARAATSGPSAAIVGHRVARGHRDPLGGRPAVRGHTVDHQTAVRGAAPQFQRRRPRRWGFGHGTPGCRQPGASRSALFGRMRRDQRERAGSIANTVGGWGNSPRPPRRGGMLPRPVPAGAGRQPLPVRSRRSAGLHLRGRGAALATARVRYQCRSERAVAAPKVPARQRRDGPAAKGAGSRFAQYPGRGSHTAGRVEPDRPGGTGFARSRRGCDRAQFPAAGSPAMTTALGDPALRAWAYLSRVAEPPCAELAELVRQVGPAEAADRVRRGLVDDAVARHTHARREIDCAEADLEALFRRGGRLITPGDDEWPLLALAAFDGAGARLRGGPPMALWA